MTMTLLEAQTMLPELIERARAGEEILLTEGTDPMPIAKLTLLAQEPPRRLGYMAHLGIKIPDSFFDPLPEEELRLWEGEEE